MYHLYAPTFYRYENKQDQFERDDILLKRIDKKACMYV